MITEVSDSSYVPNIPVFGPNSVIVTGCVPANNPSPLVTALPSASVATAHVEISCDEVQEMMESSVSSAYPKTDHFVNI